MRTVVLDARRLTERTAAHAYLARKWNAPEHYGHNLDALYDILTETTEPTMLLVMQSARAAGEWPRFREVLEAAAQDSETLQLRILS